MENGMWSRWRKVLTRTLLAVTVSMTTSEFIEVQKLSHDDLRARFKLSPSCDPSLTALNTDPAANQMTVAIECRARLAPPSPGDRREPRPAGKGS
jgi:hypothetical protein